MKLDSPTAILAVLLSAAVVCFVAGVLLSRQETEERLERDRSIHRDLVKQLDAEIESLEELYQSHLRTLARFPELSDTIGVQRAAERVAGVRQLTVLHWPFRSSADRSWYFGGWQGKPPTFRGRPDRLGGESIELDPDRFFGESVIADHGWIDEPGKPTMYWHRRTERQLALVTVESHEVSRALNGWIRDWCERAFDPLAVTLGPDRLEGPDAEPLFQIGDASGRPQVLLPLPTRFGTWQLASWDHVEKRVRYQIPTLITGVALGVLMALLGCFAFAQQRQALRLAKTRVSFVNRVSHELRSPLTNILLNADLAADSAEENAQRTRERLGLIHDEANRLSRLIANVLTFSRREKGKLRIELAPCVPEQVIREVLDQFESALKRQGIRVQVDSPLSPELLLDRDALFQILANLVSNVEKYGATGKELTVQSRLHAGHWYVTVSDKGPGVAPQFEERLFKPFERLQDHVSEGTSGTGLGLAIARGLAQDMGGSLELKPSTEGATFELRVPAPPASKAHLS